MYRIIRPALLTAMGTMLLTAPPVHAEQERSMDGWPDWIQKSMADESRKLKLRKVKFPDKSIQAKLPGKPAKAEAIENGWYLTSDIKAGSPLECYIFKTSSDIATMANEFAENSIAAVGENNRASVEDRSIYHVAAGEVAGFPYVALEWIYALNTGSESLIGFTKVRIANKGEVTYGCVHNYLGYRETFRQAFENFISNAKVDDPTPEPYYEEIATMNMADIGYGVVYTSFTIDEDGDTREYSFDAALVPVDEATLTYTDSVSLTFARPDGSIINALVADVENGELTNQLELQRNESGAWISSGTLQGKDIETEIDGALSPASVSTTLTKTRELFAGDEPSTHLLMWIPSVDPTRFLDTRIVRDDAEVARKGTIDVGPMQISGLFDEAGNMKSSTMTVGPVSIDMERVWSRGSLTQ